MNPEMKISGANKTRAYNAMPTHLMRSNGVEKKTMLWVHVWKSKESFQMRLPWAQVITTYWCHTDTDTVEGPDREIETTGQRLKISLDQSLATEDTLGVTSEAGSVALSAQRLTHCK